MPKICNLPKNSAAKIPYKQRHSPQERAQVIWSWSEEDQSIELQLVCTLLVLTVEHRPMTGNPNKAFH